MQKEPLSTALPAVMLLLLMLRPLRGTTGHSGGGGNRASHTVPRLGAGARVLGAPAGAVAWHRAGSEGTGGRCGRQPRTTLATSLDGWRHRAPSHRSAGIAAADHTATVVSHPRG